jgi:hypothetical protein
VINNEEKSKQNTIEMQKPKKNNTKQESIHKPVER